MKIIITGATGSLGAHLTRHYAAAGHEVVAVGRTRQPPEQLLKIAWWQRADITHAFSLPDADVIVHAAGLADDRASRQELFAANVLGTQNVIEAAGHIPKFVFISSSSVYHFSEEPIREEFSAYSSEQNLSPYGWSKLQSEKIVLEKSKSEQNIILRPRGIYGPGDKVLLPRLLRMVKNGKMISPGKMNVQLSMTHFENLAHAVDCAISNTEKGNRAYNVADENSYALFDALKKLLDAIHQTDLPVTRLPLWLIQLLAQLRLAGLSPLFLNTVTRNVVLDISRIRSELNYQPKREFYSAVPEISSWVEKIGGVEVLKNGGAALPWK